MIVHEKPLSWYVDKLKAEDYFSIGRYGDGAWIAIAGLSNGLPNAEGGIFTPEMGEALHKLLDYNSPSYYFSIPTNINRPELSTVRQYAEAVTDREFLDCEVWDKQSRLGGLVPFIQQIQKMKTCIISNKQLRKLSFLKYDHFIEIGYPNCFDEVDSVIEQVKNIGGGCVYLVFAGQPAPIITQQIHFLFSDVFALDVGSIWDAFIRIGSQRGWRNELYADDIQYAAWLDLYKDVL